jgi:hypothetical protein
MQAWGLEPLGDAGSFVQQVEIERPETAAPPTLVADGAAFTHGKDLRILTLGAARVSGPLQKYTAGATVKPGAILLLPQTSDAVVGKPADAAMSVPALVAGGAAAILRLSPSLAPVPPNAPLPAPPSTILGTTKPAPPRATQVELRKETYDAIAKLADGATIAIAAEQKPAAKSHTWNAIGRLTGSDPVAAKDVVLLSAHHDHLGVRTRPNAPGGADTIYNGADDDASGTIAVLELAHAIARGPRPKRTIVFAFFGSEELGGVGSRYFADKPVVPLSEVVANLQFEMIGRPDDKVPPHTLWLTGYERSTLGPALAKQGAKLVQDPHPEQNFFMRSDNIQFARRGVVAHTVSSYGLHKEYHQPSDEIGRIDFAHMTDAIRSMVEPVRWLANSSFKPEWLPGMKP